MPIHLQPKQPINLPPTITSPF
jgi:hypothetical protein